jgi:hypothetical protein
MSSRRVEARRSWEGEESVGVIEVGTGSRRFERDWPSCECKFGTRCTGTYNKTAEDAVDPGGMAHDSEEPALPRPVEDRLRISLLKVSEL